MNLFFFNIKKIYIIYLFLYTENFYKIDGVFVM